MTNKLQDDDDNLEALMPLGDLGSDAIQHAEADAIRIGAYKDAFLTGIAGIGAVTLPFYVLWLASHGFAIDREFGLCALAGWGSLATFLWVRNGGKRK